MSLSSISISGRLKEDPKKRLTTNNVPITNLLLEVAFVGRGPKPGESQLITQIVRINAWRDLADECESLKSGDIVLVSGRALINAYTTQEGKKKRELEIDASSVTLMTNILELKRPEAVVDSSSSKITEKSSGKDAFSVSPGSLEQGSDLNEIINSQEEIPF